MWAATDLDKTRVLLMHGADVNARSDDARTPLMIAAGRPGNAPVVKLLLEQGANPNPSRNPAAESSPLIEAAMAGDAESMQLLIDRGADIKSAGGLALAAAVATKCSKCIELLSKNLDAAAHTLALLFTAPAGDVNAVRLMLDHGADVNRAGHTKSVELAAQWLSKTESKTNDDRSWRLLGLAWADKDRRSIQNALRELLSAQRPDGGWSDIASIDSTAYATGLALVALHTAGFPVSDSAYQRGVEFLLSTQLEDGSWYVKTRALGFQPYFESGFPHGADQWISAAGTNWATMALTLASRARLSSSVAGTGF